MLFRTSSSSARLLGLGLSALLISGCAGLGQREPPRARRPARPVQTVDPVQQQKYYDIGLKYYTEEHYAEAKEAWQQAIQCGPDTPLAKRARENLEKTDKILKTLKSMEQKQQP